VSFVGRLSIGCGGYLLIAIAWLSFAYNIGARSEEDLAWRGLAIITVSLLGLGLYLRLRYGFSGIGYGVMLALLIVGLLAVGLVLLIIATCGGHL
jgi:hypothetical protein